MNARAALLLLAIGLILIALALRPDEQLLKVDMIPACAAVPMCKPLGDINCNPAGPFGGVDPDAGERDNRRIA